MTDDDGDDNDARREVTRKSSLGPGELQTEKFC